MKQLDLTLKKFLFGFSIFFLFTGTQAQSIEDILQAGPRDMETYLGLYVAPGMQSLGNGLANGWNNTAKPHKLLGFDLTFGVALANVPEEDRTFAFNQNSFEVLEYSGSQRLPTFLGGSAPSGSNLSIPASATIEDPRTGDEITLSENFEFDAPGGLDVSQLPVAGFPAPFVQLGVGLIKGTEVKIRWIPPSVFSGLEDVEAPTYFGFGILHDFKQWIPGMKLLPFDLSAFFGTTRFSYSQNINVNNTQGPTSFEGSGSATLSARATTFQVLISKKLSVFTPYASVGFNAVRSSINVDGNYTYTIDEPNTGTTESLSYVDPIDLQFDGAGGPRLTVGGRLKLLILTIHVDYSLQRYSTLTAGLGISIR